ncbi:hypothetical protein Cni_G04114 [Canna indica]|uniref:Uncharacterized protein n=1 Tax=Canna indica TaxID=4628 RepID=A0AAQ3Q470_9LILI|nr:hypothetical protein Cni_G04114 [Canna indica]
MASGTGESTPAVSDRKKRAFDALERRFAAEAERLQEHHRQEQGKVEQTPKSEGVSGSEKRKRGYARERSFAARAEQLQESHQQGTRKAKRALNQDDDGESEQLTGVHPKLSVSASLKKDEAQPVYSELSGIVDNNLLQPVDLKAPNAIFNDIVAKGAEGNKFLKRGKSLKIDNWILLDNYVPKDGNLKDARLKAIKSHSKRSRKHMSRRQHRKCGSFDLPKEFHNFDLFEPMHEMWKEYILDLLKEAG